jgi:non-ribosomal peptide synthetase component F
MLPLRLTMEPEHSFAAHLAAVRRRLLDAVEHQGSYLAAVVQGRQHGLRMPEATVMFNLDRPVAVPGFAPAAAELISFPVRYAKFDLSLNAIEIDSTLRLEFDYRTDLFETATIDGWSEQFVALLERLLETPDANIEDLLTAAVDGDGAGGEAVDALTAGMRQETNAARMFEQQAVAIADRLQLHRGDRVSYVGPASEALIDVGLPALLTDAIVVDGSAVEPNLDAVCDHVEQQDVTVLCLPLGTWRRFDGATRRGTADIPAHVRCLIVGSVAATAAR